MQFEPKTPVACLSVEGQEQRFCAIADELEVQARKLLADSPGRVEIATAKECFLGAVRARRAAAELARHREMIQHDRWLVSEQRQMRGLGNAGARRLKRT